MASANYKVVTVSAPVVDVVSEVSLTFIQDRDLKKGDRLLLTEQADFKKLISDLPNQEICPGGASANALAGIASFGGKVCLMGCAGKDHLADVFVEDVTKIGLETKLSYGDEESTTACCISLVTPDRERTMCAFYGQGRELSPSHVDADTICQSDILLLDGYLWDQKHNQEAFLKAAQIAKENGVLVAFSPAAVSCIERFREDFLMIIREYVDIFFANQDEIVALTGEKDVLVAAEFFRKYVKYAYLTQGKAGSYVAIGETVEHIAPELLWEAIDTTGAGDMYSAGVLYGLTHGYSPVESGKLGSLAAAEAVSHIGARPLRPLDEMAAEHFGFFKK